MSIFYPMEVKTNFRLDSVCKDHEKFFFILHQATLDKSFDWKDSRVIINHYPQKIGFSIETDTRAVINRRKMFLFLYDGLNAALAKSLNSKFYVSGDYEIVKTNGNTSFEIGYDKALIYLPQTNQLIRYDDSLDRDVFITHEYVVIIPIQEQNTEAN